MSKNLKEISELFGSNEEPVLLVGGEGTTYKAGDIILKPTSDKIESQELAELVSNFSVSQKIRLQKPVKSTKGNWIEDGYVAWTYLEGEGVEGRHKDKIEICGFFNETFKNIDKPKFIETRGNSWAIADRVSWNEIEIQYEIDFQNIINTIKLVLKPIYLSSQIIHGDIAGNIIFSKKGNPGVIDLTLYWHPADYAKALLVVDAITWEGANVDLYDSVKDLPEINQLLLRAGLRRIIEQPEQVKLFGKDMNKALEEANKYLQTLKSLNLL